MTPTRSTPYYFAPTLIALGLIYLCYEFFFDAYSMITVDEFWFAHRIYQFKDALPYRNFAPYKTVLGYYILLLPMLSTQGIIGTLVFTKNCIAILNAGILLGSGWWLRRFFNPKAIIASLIILLFSDLVLTFSTHIRVDLLAYWCCYLSLLCLLNKKFKLSGILLGLGFLISQKAIWYLFATGCSYSLYWVCFLREKRSLIDFIKLNLNVAWVIIAYLVFWSCLSDWHTVISSVFSEASAMYQLTWYDSARKLFWGYTLLYDPFLFLVPPLTLLSLVVTYPDDNNYQQRFIITIYSLTILLNLIPYKQVFPYYMQVAIPVYFILYIAFFSWMGELFQQKTLIFKVNARVIWAGLFLYLLGIVALLTVFNLPDAYTLVGLLAISLVTYCVYQRQLNASASILFQRFLIISIFYVALFFPFPLIVQKWIDVNGAYQKANLTVVNTMLEDNSDYVAGIELFYNKSQPIPGLRHLMGPAIDYLKAPDKELRNVMLPSLYEDPHATQETVIAALKQAPVKLYVNNYRMMALPPKIKDFLNSQFEHYWGSIYLYAPRIDGGFANVVVKFSGRYLVLSKVGNNITLDGKNLQVNKVVYLKKGMYQSFAQDEYRLKYIPEVTVKLNLEFREDEYNKIII